MWASLLRYCRIMKATRCDKMRRILVLTGLRVEQLCNEAAGETLPPRIVVAGRRNHNKSGHKSGGYSSPAFRNYFYKNACFLLTCKESSLSCGQKWWKVGHSRR